MFKFFTTLNAKKDKANINTVGNKVFLKINSICPTEIVHSDCAKTKMLFYI